MAFYHNYRYYTAKSKRAPKNEARTVALLVVRVLPLLYSQWIPEAGFETERHLPLNKVSWDPRLQ